MKVLQSRPHLLHVYDSCYFMSRAFISLQPTSDALTHLAKFSCPNEVSSSAGASIFCVEMDAKTTLEREETNVTQDVISTEEEKKKVPRVNKPYAFNKNVSH